jgi:hypothetical protein
LPTFFARIKIELRDNVSEPADYIFGEITRRIIWPKQQSRQGKRFSLEQLASLTAAGKL